MVILVQVVNRQIEAIKCNSMEEAQKKMREQYEDFCNNDTESYESEDNAGIYDTTAYINDSDLECDWSIIEL